jgi:hypothetical protein
MGGMCIMYEGNKRCIQNAGLKASREVTTWET